MNDTRAEVMKTMLDAITAGATVSEATDQAVKLLEHAGREHTKWLAVCVAAAKLGEALAEFDTSVAAYGKAKRGEP